jgi:hypothetical protein
LEDTHRTRGTGCPASAGFENSLTMVRTEGPGPVLPTALPEDRRLGTHRRERQRQKQECRAYHVVSHLRRYPKPSFYISRLGGLFAPAGLSSLDHRAHKMRSCWPLTGILRTQIVNGWKRAGLADYDMRSGALMKSSDQGCILWVERFLKGWDRTGPSQREELTRQGSSNTCERLVRIP